jgi:hypothetical protein
MLLVGYGDKEANRGRWRRMYSRDEANGTNSVVVNPWVNFSTGQVLVNLLAEIARTNAARASVQCAQKRHLEGNRCIAGRRHRTDEANAS